MEAVCTKTTETGAGRFDRLVTGWHATLATIAAAAPVTETEEAEQAGRIAAAEAAALRIALSPARSPRQLLAKLDVLARTLRDQHDAGSDHDCRDVAMVAAIEADVRRLCNGVTS